MRKGAIIVLAAAFALLMVSGGCGGGGDETSSAANASPAPSRSEFIARVDDVCKAGKARIESATTRFVKEHKVNTASPTKAANEDLLAEVTAPNLQRQAKEISRLPAPVGDEGKVKALVSALESGANQLEQNPSLVIQGGDPFAQAVKLAENYGIKGCSN
jgi:hypothetical protein